MAATAEAELAEESWLGESPIAAGLLVMAMLSVAAWWNGHHPVAASGLIAQAAAALLAAQRIVPLLATGRPTAAVGVPMKPVVVLTRVVIGAGVAATLAALAVILVGSDKEWPARLGYSGLAFATVGLFGYVFFYFIRVLSDAKPRRSSLDRRLAEFVFGRLGADFPATLAFYLVIVGSALQILGA